MQHKPDARYANASELEALRRYLSKKKDSDLAIDTWLWQFS